MPRDHLNRIAFALSATWVVIVFVSLATILFVLPTFKEVGHLQYGCYSMFSMAPHVACRGFIGEQAVQFFLNIPISLVLYPLFAFGSIFVAVIAFMIWTPVAYFYYSLWRKKLWLAIFGTIALVPSMFILAWFYRYAA
jgi:hypothetical protein